MEWLCEQKLIILCFRTTCRTVHQSIQYMFACTVSTYPFYTFHPSFNSTCSSISFYSNEELRGVWIDLLTQDSVLLERFEGFLSNVVEELDKSHSNVEQIEKRMKQYVSLNLSIYLSVCLSVCLFVCFSVCVCTCTY